MEAQVKEQNLHEGHRQRMKAKFLKYGLESFDDHQVLEVMLYYAIPKKDTNEIAHALVKKFGSLSGVLEAEADELIKVSGIGENAASMIKLFQMLSRRYSVSAFSYENKILLNDSKKMLAYFKELYLGEKREVLYAIALDNEMILQNKEIINKGVDNSVDISPRMLAEFAFRSNCSSIVIAHNHPQGTSLPSKADIKSTIYIHEALKNMDIHLLDHIVVGRDGAISFRNSAYAAEIW